MNLFSQIESCVEKAPFVAEHALDAKCVWFNSDQLVLDDKVPNLPKALEQLAFIAKPNRFFTQIPTATESKIELYAEHYGGFGIGHNGGGARCGNLGRFQLKGVGVTPVVGLHDNLYNSSGMYPLYEAITEAANYRIFSNLLPIGIAHSYGILAIGETPFFLTAEEPSRVQDGASKLAIGIKEACVRIGHFLPAGNYVPHPRYKQQIISDANRAKKCNQSLYSVLRKTRQFESFIFKFVKNCACQFAYARMARIIHGAVSPSNLTIEGRWLDLTNATVVPNGIQVQIGTNIHSLSEKDAAIPILRELLYSLSKYNGIEIDSKPFVRAYYNDFNKYCNVYVVELLGLDAEIFESLNSPAESGILLKHYRKVLENNFELLKGVPRAEITDGPVLAFVLNIFSSLFGKRDDCSSVNQELIESVNRMFKQYYEFTKSEYCNYQSFLVATALKSLRRLYFAPFFYVGRIYLSSRKIVFEELSSIKAFVDGFGRATCWIYGKQDHATDVVLFESNKSRIVYNPQTSIFELELPSSQTIRKYYSTRCLMQELESRFLGELIISKFNFFPTLKDLISAVDRFADQPASAKSSH